MNSRCLDHVILSTIGVWVYVGMVLIAVCSENRRNITFCVQGYVEQDTLILNTSKGTHG